ncbi:hypothetical protein D3C72_1155700 [compost metagenome]
MLQRLRRRQGVDLVPHAGMAMQACVGQQRHQRQGGRNRTDAQAAGQPGPADTRFLPQAFAIRQHPPRPGQYPLAFRRKAFETPAPAHDRQPELLLDAAHGAGQCRLRNVAKLGRTAEMARLRQRDKVSQLPDEHRASRALCPEGHNVTTARRRYIR